MPQRCLHKYLWALVQNTSRRRVRQVMGGTSGFSSSNIHSTMNRDLQSFPSVFDVVEKPEVDNRDFRVIRLSNHLEALLISDPEADKAAAGLAVNVGSYSDPSNLFGLAHFCEHLLFMGTEKYPIENEYNQYLTEHSGHSNAYTASELTNYYFEVAHDALQGALDRFSQFFIGPLFSKDCKDREIMAVDSENKKNLQNDQWRLYQLMRSQSNPDHPYNKFSTGNLHTLGENPTKLGLDVRDELIKFYKSHYSANLMKLVVLGREDLDVLAQWTVDMFSSVPNSDLLPEWDLSNIVKRGKAFMPLTPNELGKIIRARPVKDMKSMVVTFPVPDQRPVYTSQPSHYYSHLIGHEGPGSLLFYFKEQQWVNELSAGSQHIIDGSDHFLIDMQLTSLGVDHYEDILECIFQYIDMVKLHGSQKWIFDEMRDVSISEFRFRQKSSATSTVRKMAETMIRKYIPREHLLSSSVLRDYAPELLEEFGRCLRPENFQVLLVSNTFSELDQKEQWYGTEFSVENIPSDLMNRLKKATAGQNPENLHLPARNEFIATNFDVVKKPPVNGEPLKHPYLIKHTEQLVCWHKKDDRFWVPVASVGIRFTNPLANASPRTRVKSNLLVKLIQDALVEFGFAAELAGLEYTVDLEKRGFSLAVYGYNHKLPILVERILRKIVEFEPKDEARFAAIKEQVARNYHNFGYSVPFRQIGTYTLHLMDENSWHIRDLKNELEAITLEDVASFKQELLRNLDFEILVSGNMTKEEALKLSDMVVSDVFGRSKPLVPSQKIGTRSFLIPSGESYYYEEANVDEANINSCIEYVCQIGLVTDMVSRVVLETFAQISSEPAFNQLRTKEQLGYVVFSGLRTTRTTVSYRVLIQSERATDYLESRIDNFLESVIEPLLQNMTEDDFQSHVTAVINHKLEKVTNLKKESIEYWTEIENGYYNFLKADNDVELLRKITKQDVINLFNQYISPKSDRRSKLVVHLKAQQPDGGNNSAETILTNAVIKTAAATKLEITESDMMEMAMKCQAKSVDEAQKILVQELTKRMPEDKVQDFMEQVQQTVVQESANMEALKNKYPHGIKIENVGNFKAQLNLTPAPQPVEDLSKYIETGYKL